MEQQTLRAQIALFVLIINTQPLLAVELRIRYVSNAVLIVPRRPLDQDHVVHSLETTLNAYNAQTVSKENFILATEHMMPFVIIPVQNN